MEMKITELFVEIVLWIQSQGVTTLKNHEGLWRGETADWKVSFNRHAEEIENVPPLSALIESKKYFSIAVVGPKGGAVGGVREDDLIEHFRQAREAA